MAKRCVFGCLPNRTLFSIPRLPWLRSRWLEFLHFEEEGLTVNSRLCSRHFTADCFQNLTQHQMGFAKVLYLKNTAVPSVYTVGASQNMKPLSRDVGCQCIPQTPKKSVSVQASFPVPKAKRRSKAVQVQSPEHADNVCADLQTPELSSTTVKRLRMEENVDDFSCRALVTLIQPKNFISEPGITQDGEIHGAKRESHTVMNMSDSRVLDIKLEN